MDDEDENKKIIWELKDENDELLKTKTTLLEQIENLQA